MLAGHYSWQCVRSTVADPAGDETNALLIAPPGGIRIQKAYAVCEAAIAAHADNHITFSLIDGGEDATETDVMGTVGGANKAYAANMPVALTMTQTELDEGSVLLWKYDEAGTVAPGNVSIIVFYTMGGSE